MVDLSKFSDEDVKAISENRMQDVSDEGIMALSQTTPQEQKAVEDVEAKEQIDQIAQAPEATTLESMSAGFIEGVPFMKDGIAAYDAIKEAVTNDTEDSIEDIYADYKKNLDEVNTGINQAEKDNPWAFISGDIAGSLSTLPAAGLKGAMGIGALSGFSRSEERTLMSAVEGGVAGAVFHGIGVLGGKAIKKGLQGTRNLAAGTTKEAIGGVNRTSVRLINRHLKKTRQSADEFSESLFKQKVKMPNGTKKESLFTLGQEFEETLEKVSIAREDVGKLLGDSLDVFDDISMDAKHLRSRIKRKVVDPLLESDYSDKRSLGEKLLKMLDDDFMKVSEDVLENSAEKGAKSITKKEFVEPWTLKRLNQFKTDIADQVHATLNATESGVLTANTQKRKVIQELNKIIDDGVSISKKGDENALNAWRTVKKDYGNLAVAEETLERHLEGQGHGVLGNIKDLFAVRGVVVGGLSASLGIGGVPALAIGAGLNRLTTSGAMPATMAVGMKRLADTIIKNPTGEVAKRLIRTAQLPMLDFRRSLAAEVGKIQLSDQPLERTSDSVLRMRESISAIIEDKDPALAASFRSVLDSGDPDAIGQFMDSASKQVDLSQYLKEGIGFNGKVYSPEDKAMLRDQLLGNSDISLAQRLAHEKALMSNGTIPQVQPDEKPAYKHIPRRKDRHSY